MNKTIIASLTGLLFSPSIFAQQPIQTGEVVVTASRVSQSRESVIADVTVITQEEIDRAGQSTLLEVLQSQPGVEITSNGGVGKTSGLFLRGTNPGHVVVLIDGMRINSATAGTTTFENLPLAQIEKIEIVRGPVSSLYGADAIGGVIQIFTKKGEGEPRFYASTGYGTYDTKTTEAGVRGKVEGTSFALNVSSNDTNGFSSLKTNNPNLDDNDSYRNLSFSGSITQQIADGHDIGFQFLSSEGHVHYDTSSNLLFADDPAFSDNADMSQLSYALTSHNQIMPNWLSTLRLGEGIDGTVTYSAPGLFSPISRSLFKTKQRQYSWQNDFTLPVGTLTLLYDRREERVKSTVAFNEDARDNDGYLIGYLVNHGKHSLQLNYRSDHNSSFGTNNTESLGYGYNLTDNWRITGSYGTAFKAPSFNDLYYPDFGGFPSSNPDLQPEKSRNLEASLRYEDSARSASLTVYENKIRDLIGLNANFLPFNVNKARIQGLTLAGAQRWDNWQLRGSVDVQSPRDRETDNLLVRRANRHASATLGHDWGDWRFGAEAITSSARYNDAANEQRLAGYTIFNLTADYQVNSDWKLQGRLNNVFDKEYALAYEGNPALGGFIYDTPGSNLFVSVRFEPK